MDNFEGELRAIIENTPSELREQLVRLLLQEARRMLREKNEKSGGEPDDYVVSCMKTQSAV